MKIKNNQGFTLLEMMIAISIFTVVMGALYGMAFTLGRTQRVQDAGFQASQEARRTMLQLVPLLMQASRQTVNIDPNGNSFTFQVPVDTDGNGFAVDENGNMEISGVLTVAINNRNRLILTDDNGVETVLASNVNPGLEFGSGPDGEWVAADDDTNGNGRQDLGFGITQFGSRFLIQIGTLVTTTDRFEAVAELSQFVTPRNS